MYLVGPALLALWAWSKFFAPFPGAPPVNAKMTDAQWHAAADTAQAVRDRWKATAFTAFLVILALAVFGAMTGN